MLTRRSNFESIDLSTAGSKPYDPVSITKVPLLQSTFSTGQHVHVFPQKIWKKEPPKEWKESLQSMKLKFLPFLQDPQEFLQYLMSILDEEKQIKPKTHSDSDNFKLLNGSGTPSTKRSKNIMSTQNCFSHKHSMIDTNPFSGLLSSVVHCKSCHTVSKSFPFTVYSIDVFLKFHSFWIQY